MNHPDASRLPHGLLTFTGVVRAGQGRAGDRDRAGRALPLGHPASLRALPSDGGQAEEMPPWCLLTFRRQTWLVASSEEEEEEEGCWHSIMDLSMLRSSLIHALETPVTSWPRLLPLLACPQPRPSQQISTDHFQHPLNWPKMRRRISGTTEWDGGMQM